MRVINGHNKAHKYKLTNEVHKRLEKLSKELGVFQRRNEQGELMFHRVTQFLGRRYDEKKNKWFNDVKELKAPTLVNHLVNLREIYAHNGDSGVNQYVDFFKKELADQKAAKQKAKEKGNDVDDATKNEL